MIHVVEKRAGQCRPSAGQDEGDGESLGALINIRDIAEKFQLTPYTVNYYTNIGLLRVIIKQKNRRLYDRRETDERMESIGRYAKDGYPLLLIKKLINDATGGLKRGAQA